MTLKISISGIRGIIGESLTDEVVESFAAAFAEWVKRSARAVDASGKECKTCRPLIVIGRDSRASGVFIQQKVIEIVTARGCDVVEIGICPTPTVQLAVRHHNAAGGIVVTASHNPIAWNGLKFIRSDGIFLTPPEAQDLIGRYHKFMAEADAAPPLSDMPKDQQGRTTTQSDAIDHHIRKVLAAIDPAPIRAKKLRVAVDSCNGAGSVAAVTLLEALGCDVLPLYTDPAQPFPRGTEPIPENLKDLGEWVRKNRCALGFAQDPDADRLALVDETGTPLGEERTLVLAVHNILSSEMPKIWTDEASETRRPDPTVVVNLSTSQAIEDVARKFGAVVVRTAVGEVNVSLKMKEAGAIIGGEGNGGVIYPPVGFGRDSLTGMALILKALCENGSSLSKLNASIPNYMMVKAKIECENDSEVQKILRKVRTEFSTFPMDDRDGVKVIFPDGWLHVRASNTEPIVRLMAEARGEAIANGWIKKVRG